MRMPSSSSKTARLSSLAPNSSWMLSGFFRATARCFRILIAKIYSQPGTASIPDEEAVLVRLQIAAQLRNGNPLQQDGEAVAPGVDRFSGLGFQQGFALVSQGEVPVMQMVDHVKHHAFDLEGGSFSILCVEKIERLQQICYGIDPGWDQAWKILIRSVVI